MTGLIALKSHLGLALSENDSLIYKIEDFLLKLKNGETRNKSFLTLANQIEIFHRKIKLLNCRILKNINNIEKLTSQNDGKEQRNCENKQREKTHVTKLSKTSKSSEKDSLFAETNSLKNDDLTNYDKSFDFIPDGGSSSDGKCYIMEKFLKSGTKRHRMEDCSDIRDQLRMESLNQNKASNCFSSYYDSNPKITKHEKIHPKLKGAQYFSKLKNYSKLSGTVFHRAKKDTEKVSIIDVGISNLQQHRVQNFEAESMENEENMSNLPDETVSLGDYSYCYPYNKYNDMTYCLTKHNNDADSKRFPQKIQYSTPEIVEAIGKPIALCQSKINKSPYLLKQYMDNVPVKDIIDLNVKNGFTNNVINQSLNTASTLQVVDYLGDNCEQQSILAHIREIENTNYKVLLLENIISRKYMDIKLLKELLLNQKKEMQLHTIESDEETLKNNQESFIIENKCSRSRRIEDDNEYSNSICSNENNLSSETIVVSDSSYKSSLGKCSDQESEHMRIKSLGEILKLSYTNKEGNKLHYDDQTGILQSMETNLERLNSNYTDHKVLITTSFDINLPIIKGELYYLFGEFDQELEKLHMTVTEITSVQSDLFQKNLNIQTLQEKITEKIQKNQYTSIDIRRKDPHNSQSSRLLGKNKCFIKKFPKENIGNKQVSRKLYSRGFDNRNLTPNLLYITKNQNIKLQGLVNEQSLRIKEIVTELRYSKSKDRDEINYELHSIVDKLHEGMEKIYLRSVEASVFQYEMFKRLLDINILQDDLLRRLKCNCTNLPLDNKFKGDSNLQLKLNELQNEVEFLERQSQTKNSQTLDLITEYRSVLKEDGIMDTCLLKEIVYTSSMIISVNTKENMFKCQLQKAESMERGNVDLHRRVSTLTNEIFDYKQNLVDFIKHQEESNYAVKERNSLICPVEGENGVRVFDDPIEKQKLQIEELENKLSQEEVENIRVYKQVEELLEKQNLQIEDLELKLSQTENQNKDAEDVIATQKLQIDELEMKLLEAKGQNEKNKEILEAINYESDFDVEEVISEHLKPIKFTLSQMVKKLDKWGKLTADMLNQTTQLRQTSFENISRFLDDRKVNIKQRVYNFFINEKESLYENMVSKSSEVELIHKELDELNKTQVNLDRIELVQGDDTEDFKPKNELKALQKLLHDIKELKLQMLLNSRVDTTINMKHVGKINHWFCQVNDQKEILQNLTENYNTLQKYVSYIEKSLTEFQEDLKQLFTDINELQENLPQIVLGEDESFTFTQSQSELKDNSCLNFNCHIHNDPYRLYAIHTSDEKLEQNDVQQQVTEVKKNCEGFLQDEPTKLISKQLNLPHKNFNIKDICRNPDGLTYNDVLKICLQVDIMQDNLLKCLKHFSQSGCISNIPKEGHSYFRDHLDRLYGLQLENTNFDVTKNNENLHFHPSQLLPQKDVTAETPETKKCERTKVIDEINTDRILNVFNSKASNNSSNNINVNLKDIEILHNVTCDKHNINNGLLKDTYVQNIQDFETRSSVSCEKKVNIMSRQLAKYTRQNTILKALLKHKVSKMNILQETVSKVSVGNVEALPRHEWLTENKLLKDLVVQLMKEVGALQLKVYGRKQKLG